MYVLAPKEVRGGRDDIMLGYIHVYEAVSFSRYVAKFLVSVPKHGRGGSDQILLVFRKIYELVL